MLPPSSNLSDRALALTCPHCEGRGFIDLRDCSGEVQREETCSFCNGAGRLQNEGEENETE